jgi:hypothetical protein
MEKNKLVKAEVEYSSEFDPRVERGLVAVAVGIASFLLFVAPGIIVGMASVALHVVLTTWPWVLAFYLLWKKFRG